MLKGVDCVFNAGRVTAVVGHASSGKSLLFNTLAGRVLPQAGCLRVNDQDSFRDKIPIRRRVCFVRPGTPLLSHLSVTEHVQFLLTLTSPPPPPEGQVVSALRRSELPDALINSRCGTLTPLQRLSVWLAVCRLRDVRALVADEPTAEFAAPDVDDAVRLFRGIAGDSRVVLVLSRDREFGTRVADDLFVIDRGRLGPIEGLRKPDCSFGGMLR